MNTSRHCQMYVHTFGYRFRLHHDPEFTFFDVIADAHRRGFDGINVSVFGPEYVALSGNSPGHLANVRAALQERSLGIDIESNGTQPAHLEQLLQIGAQLGAEYLRTYTTGSLDRPARVQEAIVNLRRAEPVAADLGITLLLENHEELDCTEVATVVEAVDSPWVKVLFDYGNDMALGRHPLETLDRVLPWVATAHLKDQVVYTSDGTSARSTVGVPVGVGRLPIRQITELLLSGGVTRICFENTWAYVAPITQTISQRDTIFAPTQFSPDDPRYCCNATTLEQTDPRYLTETEAQMLDDSCVGLVEVLHDLPLTLPRMQESA